MWDSHGFLNIQLENVTTFDPEHLRRIWQESKGFFPWIQFWGQMSNYAGPPMYAVPRLEPGEATGCCLPIPRIHQRYLPELIDLASEMAKDGHIGYYSRPKDTQELGDHGKRFLLDWLQENMLNGANVFYIDVLGGRFFGDPLGIAAFLRDQCPPDTFIEYPVDIYPTPFLISGSLSGGNWAGGPKTKDQFILGRTAGTTFPEFGRYLLDDRIIFLGQSNGDHLFWGPTNDYWTERQVFLLGAKYDIITLFENHEEPKQMNRAVECAILERDRVDWWMRRPVYLHQNGVTDIPTGIDIRNFLGNSGENLIVIDNWIQRTNAKFRHNGSWIMIPSKPLSILVR